MQLTNSIATLLLVANVHAGCFNGGESWSSVDGARNAARTACDNSLSGDYAGNAHRTYCVNGNGQKLEFTVHRTQDSSRNLPWSECYDGLQKEITGCTNGGDTTYTNWRYM
jgi:hypothetical protein